MMYSGRIYVRLCKVSYIGAAVLGEVRFGNVFLGPYRLYFLFFYQPIRIFRVSVNNLNRSGSPVFPKPISNTVRVPFE
jgi:hypothetical protein